MKPERWIAIGLGAAIVFATTQSRPTGRAAVRQAPVYTRNQETLSEWLVEEEEAQPLPRPHHTAVVRRTASAAHVQNNEDRPSFAALFQPNLADGY